jgi:hypothetical protein
VSTTPAFFASRRAVVTLHYSGASSKARSDLNSVMELVGKDDVVVVVVDKASCDLCPAVNLSSPRRKCMYGDQPTTQNQKCDPMQCLLFRRDLEFGKFLALISKFGAKFEF